MSGFSADWLALREPFDVAARDDALAARFLAAVPRGGMVVDLGAGAGSNIGRLRALAARDGRGFAWRHVDADQDLIASDPDLQRTVRPPSITSSCPVT